MAKLSLAEFEKYQSNALVQQASDWVHSGRVTGLQEVERHFWVAKVRDEDQTYETELILTPSKISAYACECWTSPRKRMCVHIIASLLLLRRFFQQKTLENWKKNEEKKQEPPGLAKIPLQVILDRVDPVLLKDFLKEYARKNPDLGIALKTRFADVLEESSNPFLGVLNSLLPKNKAPLKPAQHRLLIRTINELSIRMEEEKSENDLTTSYKIATALLSALVPWIPLVEDPARTQLVQYCKNAFTALDYLRVHPLFSPALKEEIWRELFSILKQYPLPNELRRPVLVPFSAWLKEEPKRIEMLPEWGEEEASTSATLTLLHLLIAAQQDNLVRIQQAAPLLLHASLNALSAQEAVLELYHAGFLAAADRLADTLAGMDLSAGQTAEFRRIRMSIAEKTGNITEQIVLLTPSFLDSGSPELLLQIRQLAGERWGEVFERLLAAAKKEGNSARVSQLLDDSGDAVRLLEWYKTHESLEHLLAFSKSLTDSQLADLALPPLTMHLTTHFGRPGALFVQDALHQWLQQGRRNMVRQLIQQLVTAFPDRTGLKDTLEEVFMVGLVK
jgi:hypothetical protein